MLLSGRDRHLFFANHNKPVSCFRRSSEQYRQQWRLPQGQDNKNNFLRQCLTVAASAVISLNPTPQPQILYKDNCNLFVLDLRIATAGGNSLSGK